MNEIFEFVAELIVNHLLIGCLLTATTGLLLRFITLNAATRHNIWLGLLVTVLLMPILSFLPSESDEEPLPAPSPELQIEDSSHLAAQAESETALLPIAEAPQFVLSARQELVAPSIASDSALDSSPASRPALLKSSLLKQWNEKVLSALPLYWVGITFIFFIALGISLKLLSFVRSYGNLVELYRQSEIVNEQCLATVARLAVQIGVRNCPAVRHSAEVKTPLTSGVRHPWIVLPTALLATESSPQLLQQVLLHELAHIKRRDPLVALLQALGSIFMFWHPALLYVNQKIRFERELACDDWVIGQAECRRAVTAKS